MKLTETITARPGLLRNSGVMTLILILGIAFYNWAINPWTGYLQAADQYGSISGKMMLRKNVLTNRLTQSSQELDALRLKYENLKALCFNPAAAQGYLDGIKSCADQQQCRVVSMDYIGGSQADPFAISGYQAQVRPRQVRLVVDGSYGALTTLAGELQKGAGKIWINRFSIRAGLNESGLLRNEMEIKLYIIESLEITNEAPIIQE